MDIRIKRAYEKPSRNDGKRVLVDRLWPRGVTKKAAHIDLWMKEVAPSAELRKWFAHDPSKWADFRKRYVRELRGHDDELARLEDMAGKGPLTLVFAASDTEHNNAEVLKELLEKEMKELKEGGFLEP